MRAVVRNLLSLGRVAQTIGGYDGPTLGAKLATVTKRTFTEAQMAEARAMPARWTNVGKAGTTSLKASREPSGSGQSP